MDMDFHFHEWAFLSRVDANAFERRRQDLIEDFLRRSGRHRANLESLQREIDVRRATAGNPQEAVAAIAGMMCHSFSHLITELGGLRNELRRLQEVRQPLLGKAVADAPAPAIASVEHSAHA